MAVMAVLIAALAIGWHQQAPAQISSVSTDQVGSSSLLRTDVKAYTDNPKHNDRDHCFEQDKGSPITLSFEIYASFYIKSANLKLYNFKNMLPEEITPNLTYTYNGKMARIDVTESSPPHLGPGPYMATMSASSSARGAKTKETTKFWYYYDTFYTDYHECWI